MNKEDRIKQFRESMKCCFPYRLHWESIGRLDAINFFTAPASINHHGAYSGALFDHSLTVMGLLLDYTEKLNLQWGRPESPYIVGMFHDLCKCGSYTLKDGKWEYNRNQILPGHGEKSVIMFQQTFGELTTEEIACIRWHMGAFDDKANWEYYSRAVSQFPNVLYTHTADMAAAHIMGV